MNMIPEDASARAEEHTKDGELAALEMTSRPARSSFELYTTTDTDSSKTTANSTTSDEDTTSGLLSSLHDVPRDTVGAQRVWRNFVLFSVLVAAVPSAALACLALASARLGSILGSWQSSVLYITYTSSAVLGLTSWTGKRLGSKRAVTVGMILFGAYVASFGLSTVHPQFAQAWALSGAALGGVGAGVLWTSQGVYFTQASEDYSLRVGQNWEASTSLLGGIFAFVFLGEETVLNLLSTFMIRVLKVSWEAVFVIYSCIVIVAIMGMYRVHEYPTVFDDSTQPCSTFTATVSLLLRDAKMKYMIGLNAAFGFSGAFLNSFVSGEVVPMALQDSNSSYVGVLVALHGGVAALASIGFSRMAQHTGKGPILILGAVAFALVALPFLCRPALESWNWQLLVAVYSLQGIGRATFEGTLKATFADYFSYEKEGAFANIILQNGLASGIGYGSLSRLSCSSPSAYCIKYRDNSLHNLFVLASLVVATSALAILGYVRAASLFRAEGEGPDPLVEYQKRSISSYRNSWLSTNGSTINRQTYQTLNVSDTERVIDKDDATRGLPEVS
jgi:MFS family permease